MKNLILLTSSFPYQGGEQFLETEIKYWEKTGFDNILILPCTKQGLRRDMPTAISVIGSKVNKAKIIYISKAMFSRYFYKEILYIIHNTKNRSWLRRVKEALKAVAMLLRELDCLSSSLKLYAKDDNTVYSYWNNFSFYAACELKNSGIVNRVVSRAHRFDLYEEEREDCYMPLKRQFSNLGDKTYLLSPSAVEYYHKTYGTELVKLAVARLGVVLPSKIFNGSPKKNQIKVLSISYCVHVKQINIIMSALSKYSEMRKTSSIEWTHVGNGPLYETLKNTAADIMDKHSNLNINFIGQLTNSDVKKLLETEPFDVFINTSKSEGIPVSIMEAMSYKIPAIAPDIGGVADLVDDNNGFLMPSECSEEDVLKGIDIVLNSKKNKELKENAYHKVAENFNSDSNYLAFVKEVEKVAGINESK